ncbi:hypothetical protein FDA94_24170 [Herbidospora galbida]|uniref:Uncharacterized protein n=1 Tax=Herbidospora galbida TaxID=2575442 RepID=A0A4U3M9W9_9ACTN|nr:hypothetical protein [Herbidospora galbida]TKK85741.1 hypothetical protein FDA94_24170 [Herbidospora galbida]
MIGAVCAPRKHAEEQTGAAMKASAGCAWNGCCASKHMPTHPFRLDGMEGGFEVSDKNVEDMVVEDMVKVLITVS